MQTRFGTASQSGFGHLRNGLSHLRMVHAALKRFSAPFVGFPYFSQTGNEGAAPLRRLQLQRNRRRRQLRRDERSRLGVGLGRGRRRGRRDADVKTDERRMRVLLSSGSVPRLLSPFAVRHKGIIVCANRIAWVCASRIAGVRHEERVGKPRRIVDRKKSGQHYALRLLQ